eukprot:COSAG01_NODE_829_length_13273_cov_7.729695_8_plen_41_part_00
MDPRTFGSETSVSYRCEHSDHRQQGSFCSSTTALCRSLRG